MPDPAAPCPHCGRPFAPHPLLSPACCARCCLPHPGLVAARNRAELDGPAWDRAAVALAVLLAAAVGAMGVWWLVYGG